MITVLFEGAEAALSDEDEDLLLFYDWRINQSGYLIASLETGLLSFHRAVIYRVGLEVPKGYVIDHKNRFRLDNRRENLRVVTTTVNNHNKGVYRNNTSGFKGVHWHNERWCARIKIEKRYKHLGYFDDIIRAALAYDRAAQSIYGEDACTNF